MIFFKSWDWWKYLFREASRRGEIFWCVAYFCWCLVVTHKQPLYLRLAWIDNAHPFWDMRWDRFLLCCISWWIMGSSQVVVFTTTTNKIAESVAVGTFIMIMTMSVLCFFGMIYWGYDNYQEERKNK